MELNQEANDKLVIAIKAEPNKQVVQFGYESSDQNSAKNVANIELTINNILVVTTKGVPSTGYQWILKSGYESVLELAFEVVVASPMPGAAMEKSFVFKGIADGRTANLKFVYKRAWENVAPVKEYDVNVISKGAYNGSFEFKV
ncbi:MAG: protease inhibitor I42 family protein [Bacteroidales bacterium]|nr:protease inhibitor I42 family protein [Bacteroidales bacterium]